MKTFLTATISSAVVVLSMFASATPASVPTSTSPAGYATIDQYKAPAAPAPAELRKFSAPSGASVRETLDKWVRAAEWKAVTWALPAETDFTLGAARQFEGNVGQASKALISALGSEARLNVTVDESTRTITISPAQ